LSDAIVKHNARNPDRRIVLLNFDGRDPALTEAKCHFWHFRVNYHNISFFLHCHSRCSGSEKAGRSGGNNYPGSRRPRAVPVGIHGNR
jgi:hypothetical protein